MAWSTVSESADRSRRMSSDGESVSSAISMSFVTLSKAVSVLWRNMTGISQTGCFHSDGHGVERQCELQKQRKEVIQCKKKREVIPI